MDASEIVLQNDHRNGLRNVHAPFTVQIADRVEKSGDRTCFFLNVQRNDPIGLQKGEAEIKRFLDDFRALDRRIRADIAEHHPGVITPRLSNKETSLLETVPDNNARFMGQYAAERVMFQRYLDAVLSHPIVGRSKFVEDFLTLPDFSSYAHFKLSLAKRFTGAIDEMRTSSHVDPDDFFQKRRLALMAYSGAAADFSNTFTLQNLCKKNLSAAMSNLSLSLNSNGPINDDATRLLALSSEAIKQEEVGPDPDKLRGQGPLTSFLQYGWHLAYWNGELTLGTFLKHHIAQLDSFKDMLHHRTLLLMEHESARKNAEKSKPPKKEAALNALKECEQVVERCTTTGKEEVERIDSMEIKGFRQALIDYAESQMQAARESYEILLEQINKIRDWQPEHDHPAD